MIAKIFGYFGQSFRRKLLIFTLSLTILTTVVLYLYLMNNFRTITQFSLAQNTVSMEQTVEEYLTKYAQEKSTSTGYQLEAAQNNITVLGRTAQRIIDNYDEISQNPAIFDLSIFKTDLADAAGGKSADVSALVDTFIPPPIVDDPKSEQLARVSSLLNLNIDAVYDANVNNAFVYFVGNPPITRAYPNYHLVDLLGEGVQLLFWKDYFAPNVEGWQQWYTDADLQARVPSPLTVETPYLDAAGQGMMVTMFYPLWDHKEDKFAGAVAADITLSNIIDNVLSIRVAKTGFAFLMNGKGEIIAMPEAGYKLYKVDLTETKVGGLSYYSGLLGNSSDNATKSMAADLLAQQEGVLKLTVGEGTGQAEKEIVAFASLPPLSDNRYQEDRWRIVISVPEAEIFEALYKTDAAITQKSLTMTAASLMLVFAFLAFTSIITLRFSNSVTRDMQSLAKAAAQVSAKDYNISLDIKSHDEVGKLGKAFQQMTGEIRDYTTNLETKVAERTADLQTANNQITQLNEKLKDENLRLGAELDVARRLQMMVLPQENETRDVPDLDISGYMQPADEVGGDYYDVLKMGEDVFLSIGDVTGHGLPSGVIMMMAQTSLLTLSQSGESDMKRILSLLNQVLYRNIERIHEDKNMTLAVIRYRDHEFNIVGQHKSVLICRKDGKVEEINTMDLGFPVGMEYDIDRFICAAELRLQPGDVMLLYTDGVTEAENNMQEMYTIVNLKSSLARYHTLDADGIRNGILSDLEAFIGGSRIYDDISMLVVKQK